MKKSNFVAMILGTIGGIFGTALLGVAVYNFVSANAIIGVIFTLLGIAICGIGFYAYRKLNQQQASQIEPMIQEQLEIAMVHVNKRIL